MRLAAAAALARPTAPVRPVVIVGLGSTGAALAARLSQLGEKVVALEQYSGLVKGRVYDVAPSTVDMLAKWGIADEVLRGAVSSPSRQLTSRLADSARLGTRAPATPATSDMKALLDGIDDTDPRAWLNIGKDSVDSALRGVAERNGARLLTGTTFTRAEHTADGVRVFASGLEQPIEGSMLIFADGGRTASQQVLGYRTEVFPERARYLGRWFRSAADAAPDVRAFPPRADGFSFRSGRGETLAWMRVPDELTELASPAAREVRDTPELATRAVGLVEDFAPRLGAAGRSDGELAVADVRLRLADRVVDAHGTIGLGDLVAGLPFDRSQGFNAGILQAERAAQHVRASLAPGSNRTMLNASYEHDILDGARRIVDQSRRLLGGRPANQPTLRVA